MICTTGGQMPGLENQERWIKEFLYHQENSLHPSI